MKKFWNQYKIEIMIFLLLLLFFLIVFYQYQIKQNELRDLAEKLSLANPEYYFEYRKQNAYELFLEWFYNSELTILQFLLPLLVSIPGGWWLFQKKRSGFLKSMMMRENYSKMMWKELFRAWKSALILPLFFLVVFLITACYSQTFHPLGNEYLEIGAFFRSCPIIYLLYYTFNLYLISIFFINITLFFILKNKSYILTLLTSFFTIFGYQIIAELFIGVPLAEATGVIGFANSFTSFNLWTYDSVVSFSWMTGYCLTLIGISVLLLAHAYSKKEKVVLAIET